ncbi:uncharacterized protein [Maniola hyperantus]|uniref:uncharacterized protein n=1 Tax=Aphantopus hyperantus TaxID=2795564 RepID=UPI003749AC36
MNQPKRLFKDNRSAKMLRLLTRVEATDEEESDDNAQFVQEHHAEDKSFTPLNTASSANDQQSYGDSLEINRPQVDPVASSSIEGCRSEQGCNVEEQSIMPHSSELNDGVLQELQNRSILLSDLELSCDSSDEYIPDSYESSSSSSDNEELPAASTESLSSHLNNVSNITSAVAVPESPNQLSRKRKRNPKLWKRNVRKENRTHGRSYTSCKGTLKLAKQLGPSCNCKKKCADKFPEYLRQKIFAELYDLTAESQSQYIASLIEEFPKKSTKVVNGLSRRQWTRKYFFTNQSETRTEVCQTMFLNTLSLSLKKVRVIVEKKRNSEVGILSVDQRGRHQKQKRISEASKMEVKEHIKMFPAYESHYSRSHTQKKYLNGDLSIALMYRLYVTHCNENGQTPVKESYYRKVFVEEFNLTFKKPKNDTCGKCDKFKLQLEVEPNLEKKQEIEAERYEHEKLYESSYAEKRRDNEKAKVNDKVITLSFDLQKCLPTPYLTAGFSFYKRQLWTLNLTIYRVSQSSADAYCLLWDETIAGRGGQEIASCLYHHLNTLPNNLDEINMYSDSCPGQNRNIYVAIMIMYFIENSINSPRIINLKFLEPGHTHMEADTIHASIEKAKKKTAMKIELPKDWANLIRTVHRNPKINVVEMQQSQFYNFQKLLTTQYVHRKINSVKEKVNWTKIKWIQCRKVDPGVLYYKYSFDDSEELFKVLSLKRNRNMTRSQSEDTAPVTPLVPLNQRPM